MTQDADRTGRNGNPNQDDAGHKADDSDAGKKIRDSAQQIWLAGLGAFAKAQQEGAKAFESLVKEGLSAQKKTQAAAEDGFTQARSKVSGFAEEFSERATGQWGKLENIFEERVARALTKLGMPSAADVAALRAQVVELRAEVAALQKFSAFEKPEKSSQL